MESLKDSAMHFKPQICKHCSHVNAPAKRTCDNCSKILEGYTHNNVTGEYGYRHADGSFTVEEEDKG